MTPEQELFPAASVASESPKLKWMKANDLTTHYSKYLTIEEQPWCCHTGDLMEALSDDALGYGETEDDAIFEWAKAFKVPLWNEQEFVEGKK